MCILTAIDSFKGTIGSIEGSSIIRQAILDSGFDAEVVCAPMADGGEGSIEIVRLVLGGEYVDLEVMGPCLNDVKTHYLLNGDKAYIEVAQVAGYTQIDDLSILERTSEGLGMVIIDAIQRGAKELNIFLGGSATSDLGLGMLYWLGARFYDEKGEAFDPLPEIFKDIHRIDIEGLSKYKDYRFNIIGDVNNPLVGPRGASHTYARQKGASEEDIKILEDGALHVCDLVYRTFGDDIRSVPGYGCSGGMGMAFSYFLNAHAYAGSAYFASLHQLEELVSKADLVITGEGKLDNTSFNGKVVSLLVALCKEKQKKLVAIVGKCDLGVDDCRNRGISEVVVLSPDEADFETIKRTAKEDLYSKTFAYFAK